METGVALTVGWTQGLFGDRERLNFSEAVARKFGRFAFPDDLPMAMAKWRNHVVAKHDKVASPEGTLFRAAVDVRLALASQSSWEDENLDVRVILLFPPGFLPNADREEHPDVSTVQAIAAMDASQVASRICGSGVTPAEGFLLCERIENLWAEKCIPTGVIHSIEFELIGTDEMTVEQYRSTYSFDLEFLSSAEHVT